MQESRSLQPDSLALLPHKGVALLVQKAVQIAENRVVCESLIPAASPFVSGGRAPAFLAMELAAQATLLMEIARAGAGVAVSEQRADRYLVTIRDSRFRATEIPAEHPLMARVEMEGNIPPLTVYRVWVTLDGDELARGTISTYSGSPERA